MLITVMIPTRGREAGLRATVDSFLMNASHPNMVQFIIKIDDDDPTRYAFPRGNNIKTIISPRLRGYESIHTFCNEMLYLATGRWIMLGNDDATMVTKGWDDVLRMESPRCVLLNPSDEHGNHAHIFPIVNRKICLELGHFALNAFTDRWLQNVYPQDKIKDIPIRIKHDIISDQSSEDRRTAFEYSTIEWEDTRILRDEIKAKLMAHD